MKTIRTISFLALAYMAILTISCKKTTESSDMTLTVTQDRAIGHLGDTIPLTISASTSNDEIKSITMTKTGGIAVAIPGVINSKNYSAVVNYIVTDSEGTLVFTISEKGGLSDVPIQKTLTYSIVKDIEITLGTQTSTFSSFINGSTLAMFTAANAFANQGSVDLVYTYSATDGICIGAPIDPVFNLSAWTTKNNTKIGKIMDETPEAVSMVTGSSVKNLAMGDMLGYITASGVKGIIEVMDMTPGVNGNTLFTFMVIK
jgi:hypothetical protein